MAVHEYDPVGIAATSGLACELRANKRAACGCGENATGNRRNVREAPLLIVRGRKAELLESVHRLSSHAPQPGRPRRGQFLLDRLEGSSIGVSGVHQR